MDNARGKGIGRAYHIPVSHSTPLRGVSFQRFSPIIPVVQSHYSSGSVIIKVHSSKIIITTQKYDFLHSFSYSYYILKERRFKRSILRRLSPFLKEKKIKIILIATIKKLKTSLKSPPSVSVIE